MKITAKKITAELQNLWPELLDVWPMDKEFWCPTLDELQLALEKIRIHNEMAWSLAGGFAKNIHDCDNFALELQADISRYRFVVANEKNIKQKELLSWAFGSALCLKVKGWSVNHTVCICRTSDAGFVFIEPRDNQVWVADPAKDSPYFVEMR